MKIELIPLKDILADTTYQLRDTSVGKNIAELCRLDSDGIEIDPVILWEIARGKIILDGFQRVEAKRLIEGDEAMIRAVVKRMSESCHRTALDIAIAANQKHGMTLEKADRKKMAVRLLSEAPQVPDTQIAKKVGLSARTIGNYRKEVDGAQTLTRVDSNGRQIKVRKPDPKMPEAGNEISEPESVLGDGARDGDTVEQKLGEKAIPHEEGSRGVSPVAVHCVEASSHLFDGKAAMSPIVLVDPTLNLLSGQLTDVTENISHIVDFLQAIMAKPQLSGDELDQLEAIKSVVPDLMMWNECSF